MGLTSPTSLVGPTTKNTLFFYSVPYLPEGFIMVFKKNSPVGAGDGEKGVRTHHPNLQMITNFFLHNNVITPQT